MYVTRPLSLYLRSPESLSLPPEGPNSGYLVIQDEESETTTCFGLCKNRYLIDLPFPQNKNLTVTYTTSSTSTTGTSEVRHVSHDEATLIPVLNQPLSSNIYYAIKPHGSHKGEAYACSKEEDMSTCCFCNCIRDVKPRPLNPYDIYQQFQIHPYQTACTSGGSFYAVSIAQDGFPPYFLRRKGWEIFTKTPKNYELGEALGTDAALRARLPAFDFPVSYKSSLAIVVGKWYCPFVFIKDIGTALRDQMKDSIFYAMTLEQRWEQIFSCENDYSKGNVVSIDVGVQREMVTVGGREAEWDESNVVDGMIWFRSFGGGGGEVSVGLSSLIVERMKWEQERGGWVGGEKRKVRVNRREEFGGTGGWSRFACYVLVESFVLKRMDRTVVLTYDFKHTHLIRSKWE